MEAISTSLGVHFRSHERDAQGNKFSFNLSKNGCISSRFASEAEHTARPISRNDLGSGPKREDIHDRRQSTG